MREKINQAIIEQELRKTFPACTKSFASSFIALLNVPIEEIATQSVLILEKPYGRNHILIDHGDFGISCALLLPGRSTSLHYHHIRKEFFCVRRGGITLTSGIDVYHLHSLECGISTPEVSHALANSGDKPAEVLEVFSPALLDDKYRISDPYTRRTGNVGVSE
jgi:mannose-6-phosphate isomerase-like protein (cupin superfamily)